MSERPDGPAGAGPSGPAGASPAGQTPGDLRVEEVRLTVGGKPSGLRNPTKAMRGLGAGALFLEAVVLLLAFQPIRMLNGGIDAATTAFIFGSAAAALLITGLLKHNWGWWLGSLLQVALLVGGLLDWMIAAVGVIFGLVWVYVLHVRRTVLG